MPQPLPPMGGGPGHGRAPARAGRSKAGLIARVAVGAVLLGGAAYGALSAAERDDDGAITQAGDLDATQLAVGDCLQTPEAEEFVTVDAVPCSELHDDEVYYVGELATPAGEPWPGDDPLVEEIALLCYDQWGSYLATPYESSVLDFSFTYPAPDAWRAGDRGYSCVVYDPAGPVTGSLRGASR